MAAIFKLYNQNQDLLLPPSLEDMIDKSHPVRVLSKIVDAIDISSLEKSYIGGGTTSYSPRMLLKILIYAYMNNVYSSRRIELLLKENINYMWLTTMQKPDHNTINRFRSKRLESSIKEIFKQVVLMFHTSGILDIKEIYTDGTKIEANANKYSFVWGKNIIRRKEKILEQINELWDFACKVSIEELRDVRPQNYEAVNPGSVKETIEEINKGLSTIKIEPKIRAKLNRAKKHWVERLTRDLEYEKQMEGRNSCSKTDTDALFMRMKDDHMKNGQLKAGYNVQISTNNQMIINYSIHQTAADTTTLKEHIENYKELYSTTPETITADAGYGSHENYKYLEEQQTLGYVKYNNFHQEQKSKWQTDISKSDNLYYNETQDCYYCPMGQAMEKISETETKSKTGFAQIISKYRATNCNGCPLRGACHKSAGNRTIEVNKESKRLRQKAKELLISEEGLKKRSRRPIEPETVFGNIKHNKHYRRFLLRGKKKVEIEFGLLALAHNLSKKVA